MPAGITTQYGFLFQRYIFIKTVLDFIGIDTFLFMKVQMILMSLMKNG